MQEWLIVLLQNVFLPSMAYITGLIFISYGISKALSLFDIKTK